MFLSQKSFRSLQISLPYFDTLPGCRTKSFMSVELQKKRKKSLSLNKKNKVSKTIPINTAYPYTIGNADVKDDTLPLLGEDSIRLPTEQIVYLNDLEADASAENTMISPKQESKSVTEQVVCPVCSMNLVGSTRLQKLEHVNKCLDAEVSHYEEAEKTDAFVRMNTNDSDIQACVFCGKDMSTYNNHRQEQHANRCLDEIVTEQRVIELSKKTAERYNVANSYGNTAIPMRYNVEICPCCREDWTHRTLSLRSKMLHMKSCANKKGISIEELERRLQWTNWGLLIPQTHRSSAVEAETVEQYQQKDIKDTDKAKEDPFVLCTSDDETFQSLSLIPSKPICTKPKKLLKNKQKDSNNEDLQLAIALSKSIVNPVAKGKSKKSRKVTEQDKNSSSVLSIEDSKLMVSKIWKAFFVRHVSKFCNHRRLPPFSQHHNSQLTIFKRKTADQRYGLWLPPTKQIIRNIKHHFSKVSWYALDTLLTLLLRM